MNLHIAFHKAIEREAEYSLPEVVEALIDGGYDENEALDIANQIGTYWAGVDMQQIIFDAATELDMYVPPTNA